MKKSNKDPALIFDNNIAKNFVNELFDSIRLSKSVEDLQLIPKKIKYGSHLEQGYFHKVIHLLQYLFEVTPRKLYQPRLHLKFHYAQ
jgi:hypothetical protein